MRVKLCVILLLAVLFLTAISSVYAENRSVAFNASHVDVYLNDVGPVNSGNVLIGTRVKVTLQDPDLSSDPIQSATVNFVQFGGPVINMVPTGVPGKWVAEYTMVSGNISGANARAVVTANGVFPNTATQMDDAVFTVYNEGTDISDLVLNTNILSPGTGNIAIVNSVIQVYFAYANVASATADFTPFGGPANVAFIENAGIWTASYTVQTGNSFGSFPIAVTVVLTTNPNPGVANTAPVSVNNLTPDASTLISHYLSVINPAGVESLTSTLLKINDTLRARAVFNNVVTKVWIDWSLTFPGKPIIDPIREYVLNNGVLLAEFTPEDGAIVYDPNVTVYIVKLETNVGNIYEPLPGDEIELSLNSEGDPIVADLATPTLVGTDLDLYFDNNPLTGWLRFSPNSTLVAGYPVTLPDHVEMKLRFTNWGVPGDLYGFQLRFEAERSSFTRDYDFDDDALSVSGSDITISWDGKDGNGQFVASGTYGVTLWKVWDQVGNTLSLGNRYIIANEYPPHSSLLNVDLEPQVILNRMHVVVDNNPLTFVQPATPWADVTFTHNIHTDHFVGDVTFPDQVYDTWVGGNTQNTYTFQVQRDFLVDSNALRWEKGTYWILQSDTAGNMWYWNKNTSSWVSYVAFDPNTMKFNLEFPTSTAQNANPVSFSWNATTFAPSTYTVKVYLQDNSGNVSLPQVATINNILNVTEATYDANLAVINEVLITSHHNGGVHTLAAYDLDGDHNFYLNGTTYYNTPDSIAIRITLNNKDYLKTGNALQINLSNLGLGTVWKTAADFDVNQQTTHIITRAQMRGLPSSRAGEWTLGTSGGARNLPITAISSIRQPNLTFADYPVVSTHSDKFNLIVPAAPVYPLPGTLSIGDASFSPGHPSWTYNAQINPANDGIQDSTRITLSVPASTYPLRWELFVSNPATNGRWTHTGNLAANVALPPTTRIFMGLTDQLAAMADPMGVQTLDVGLIVRVTAYADTGYVAATDQTTSLPQSVTIDNQNPTIVAGEGYTYNPTTKTATFTTIAAMSSVGNTFEVTLNSNEPLRIDNLNQIGSRVNQTPGWSASVVNAEGNPIMHNGNPLTASVLTVADLGSNRYRIQVQVNGTDNVLEHPNAVMVLRLPWDNAGNPGRKNDPMYPVVSDLFYYDSSEVNFNFHILNARPWISEIQWTNYQKTGVVEYDEAGTGFNMVQGYVNNYPGSTGTLKAWVAGGISRDIVTTFKADVSSISTMANAAALPATAAPVGGGLWMLTWDVTNMRTTLAEGVPAAGHEIKVYAITTDGLINYHSNTRSIFVKVDKTAPVVASTSWDGTANNLSAGSTTNFTYNINDALAGIWWNAASISLSFTNGVTHSGLVYNEVAGTVTGSVTLPANTNIKNTIATFTVKDLVNNTRTLTRNLSVIPAPVPSNVVITGAFPAAPLYFRPGTTITVDFAVTNPQRADKIDIKLFNHTTNTQVGATQTITAPTELAYTRTFTSVTIPSGNTLRADVIVTYSKYDNATAALNANATNSATSAVNLIADGVAPVISAVEPQIELLAGSAQILSFNITDALSGVDWATPTISFNPAAGITIGALDITEAGKAKWNITVDSAIVAQRVIATITAKDKVVNEGTLLRYLNIMPIPVVTNLLVSDMDVNNPNPTNWFVPGHDLKVSFNVSNPQRVNQLSVTLSADGVTFAQATQSFTVGQVTNPMNVIFPALTAANLDGKVITATVTGSKLSYTSAVTGGNTTVPLITTTDQINVDTRPVVNSIVVKYNDVPVNTLLSDMDDLSIEVVVTSPNALNNAQIHLQLLTQNFGAPSNVIVVGNTHTYTWTGLSLNDLTWANNVGYIVANLDFHIPTIYGYMSAPYTHQLVVINNDMSTYTIDDVIGNVVSPASNLYGYVNDRAYPGYDPQGWFAPEHLLMAKYLFISAIPVPTQGIVGANFDLIEDLITDNWNYPPVQDINTIAVLPTINLIQGGASIPVVLTKYQANWSITPDYQSVWNAYYDGEHVAIDFKHKAIQLPDNSFTVFHTETIQVDKSVPLYDETSIEIAVGTDPLALSYEIVNNPFDSAAAPIKLVNGLDGWPAGQAIYIKYRAKDQYNDGATTFTGSGIYLASDLPMGSGISNPTVTGWTIDSVTTTTDPVLYPDQVINVIKLLPEAGFDFEGELQITLNALMDKTGHINYNGPNPIQTDPLYRASINPITIIFDSNYITGIDYIKTYKYIGSATNEATYPYAKADERVGLKLHLSTARGVDVDGIEVSGVDVNVKYLLNKAADATTPDQWVTLSRDGMNDELFYLTANVVLDPDYLSDEILKVDYRINYLITYMDGSTSVPQPYIGRNIQTGRIDNQMPILTNVEIWSESLGIDQEGYVASEDLDGMLRYTFTDNNFAHQLTDPNAKPKVYIRNLENVFLNSDLTPLTLIPYAGFNVFEVLPENITYMGNNTWQALVHQPVVVNPPLTSQTFWHTIVDPLSNATPWYSRMVEIIPPLPHVPIIRDVKLVTTIDTDAIDIELDNKISESNAGVSSEIRVYIDVDYPVYIQSISASVDDATGIADLTGVPYTISGPIVGENYTYIASIPVIADANIYNGLATRHFTVVTRRNPLPFEQGQVFEQIREFDVAVVGDSYDFVAGAIENNITSLDVHMSQDGLVNTAKMMQVTAVFENIYENENPAIDPLNNRLGRFLLHNAGSQLFANDGIAATSVTLDNANAIVVWEVPATEILSQGDAVAADLKISYRNLFERTQETAPLAFNIDVIAPVVTGYELYNADGDLLHAFAPGEPFTYNEDWYRIRVLFSDLPAINAGLYAANVDFDAYPQTYTYINSYPEALAALNSIQQMAPLGANNYVDLQFSGIYSGRYLSNGLYKVVITGLEDQYTNTAADITKNFTFGYAPAEMTINIDGNEVDDNYEVLVGNAPLNVIAYTSSTLGGIIGVDFRLYYDDGDGTFDPTFDNEITPHLSGTPDYSFPYGVFWNMTDELYAFIEDAEYDGIAYRNFWLRASVITQNRDLFDAYKLIRVYDNVAPIPMPSLATITQTINYEVPAQNNLDIPVNFAIRDAREVKVEIYKGLVLIDTLVEPIVNHHGLTLVNWDFDGNTPGSYSTMISAKDFTGNWSVAINGPAIELENAVMNAFANTHIYQYMGSTHAENLIDGTIFGSNNIPISAENYIVLEARIGNTDTPAVPLNGIEAISFSAVFQNKNTGVETVVAIVPNNVVNQNHIPASGIIESGIIPVIGNEGIIRLAIPNSFFDGYITQGEDYTFSFRVEIDPIHDLEGIDLLDQAYNFFRIDWRAPALALSMSSTQANDHISWTYPGTFTISGVSNTYLVNQNAYQYDYDDVDMNSIQIQWRRDGGAWTNAEFINNTVYDAANFNVIYPNWDIRGGGINTYLGEAFEGDTQIEVRVIAADSRGNSFELQVPLTPWIDYQAPNTVISHVLHAQSYPDVTPVPVTKEIDVIASTQGGNGSSDLHLLVSSIDADARIPLMLYHGVEDALGNVTWQFAAYEHEAWNLGNPANPNFYEFIVPSAILAANDRHHFVVAMRDAMGNLEADAPYLLEGNRFNDTLSAAELNAMTDLIVNVENIDDIYATIAYPTDLAFISGHKAISATVPADKIDEVDQIRIDRRVNGAWQPVTTLDKEATHTITFNLLRNDVPQYNNLPWVPGIHLFDNNTELGEMIWNNATQSWSGDFVLNTGTTYTFQYGVDFNNNGTWDMGEPLLDDPKGFISFTPSPWTMAFDSTDPQYATAGLYEFRAVPLNVHTTEALAPSRWMIIDNTPPVINGITSVGAEGMIIPVQPGEELEFVTDIIGLNGTPLLVAADDIINVRYEASGQPVGTVNRKWTFVDASTSMSGNYLIPWTAEDPLFDRIDNDGDGLVDENDEANSTYYIRAIANDRAGNYVTSSEVAIKIDRSTAQMILTEIQGVTLATTNYVYQIDPALSSVTLTATELMSGFDSAATADFYYQFKPEIGAAWNPTWTKINAVPVVVNAGVATQAFTGIPVDGLLEGYYQFKVVAFDAIGNVDGVPIVTTVIFNDVTGPQIAFETVGTRPVIEEEYAFAQTAAGFNGVLVAHLSDMTGVSAVTFEYAAPNAQGAPGTWTNVTTVNASQIVADGLGGGTVTVANWTLPALRSPMLFLKAVAQDDNANNMETEIVRLYLDATAPDLNVVSLTHAVTNNKTYINIANDIALELEYLNLVDGMKDVKNIGLKLVNIANNNVFCVIPTDSPYLVNMVPSNFAVTTAQLVAANLTDGIYKLEVALEDFAGNIATLNPAAYQALYLDRSAPVINSIVAIDHAPLNQAVYNETIAYEVNYFDLIGVPAVDNVSAIFTYGGVTQTVNTYTVDEVAGIISFDWNPAPFAHFFTVNGMEEITVNATLTATDYLGNVMDVPAAFNFTLIYGVPNATKIMVVKDKYIGFEYDQLGNQSWNYIDQLHFVNWAGDTGVIPAIDPIGTNHTNNPEDISLYAYVAHDTELPVDANGGIEFYYQPISADPSDVAAWTLIGTGMASPAGMFVDPAFFTQYQREYSMNWDISALATGQYRVMTRSYHTYGYSDSRITMNIYNGILAPQFTLGGSNAATMDVERGETYPLETASFTGTADYARGVIYKYRFVDALGNPISQWTNFGDEHGNPIVSWNEDFSFDWTVYPYYLYNNRAQIVAHAIDKWGTETPIASVMPNAKIAHIKDTTAPVIAAINLNWINNDIDMATDYVSAVINPAATISARITTLINPSDLDHVEFYFNNVLVGSQVIGQTQPVANDYVTNSYAITIPALASVTSGTLRVVATDVYGNTRELENSFMIDNALPTANVVLTNAAGTPVTAIERGQDIVLLSNAADPMPGTGVASVSFSYKKVSDANWTALATVNAAPYNYTWLGADTAVLEYGAEFVFKADVIDNIGLAGVSAVTEAYEVIDNATILQIVSVGGHNAVNNIVPVRLHGDFDVVATVTSPSIVNVEYLYRSVEAEADPWTSIGIVPVVGNNANITAVNFDDMISGDYYLAIRPREATRTTLVAPVHMVMITIDNDLDIDVISSMPAAGGAIGNGVNSLFTVQFEVLPDADGNIDAISAANVELLWDYVAPYNGTWRTAGTIVGAPTTLDGTTWTAVFNNINIMHNGVINDGVYNFAIRIHDSAQMPNVNEFAVAANVIYDTHTPNVAITSINGITEMNEPIQIMLGTDVAIAAAAHDIMSGQLVATASGIEKIEFMVNGELIGTSLMAPYTVNWNTLGLLTGNYNISAIAYDNAGNMNTYSKTVSVVAPTDLQPAAIIRAMSFDPQMANQDKIYFETATWNNESISSIAFDYSNDGTNWMQFANIAAPASVLTFNAELMTGVTRIRTRVFYNDNMESSNILAMNVAFSAADGGSLIAMDDFQTDIYYRNNLYIVGDIDAPKVGKISGGVYTNVPMMPVDEMYRSVSEVAIASMNNVWWVSTYDLLTNTMQLEKVEYATYNAGTATDATNTISVTVPSGYVHFQPVMYPYPMMEGFSALSTQVAVLSNPIQALTYTMSLNATPAANGTIVALYHDGNTWMPVSNSVYNAVANTVTFTANSGMVFALGQYADDNINVMFSSITPQYENPAAQTWTVGNPEIKFFVYDGIDQSGYTTPVLSDNFTYEIYLDNVLLVVDLASQYNAGVITIPTMDYTAGTHTVRVEATMNGFTAMAEKTFHVDLTAPVIVATGSQLNMTQRTISATITDPETGLYDVYLTLNMGANDLTIPMQNLTTNGSAYSYVLTDTDLAVLGYTFAGMATLEAEWSAANNLLTSTVTTQVVNYTVSIEGPAIAFTLFENGWWINPTANRALTFNVTVPAGRTMPADGVIVNLYEISQGNQASTPFQTMTLAANEVNGNVYSYSLNFGYAISPQTTAVKLSVTATDSYSVSNMSEQTYGVDYLPPTVHALAPEASSVIPYGNEVAIGVGFEDLTGYTILEYGEYWEYWENFWNDGYSWHEINGVLYLVYYTSASGINSDAVVVTLNGTPITNGAITNGTFVANAGMLDPGSYTVIASVPDNAGNVGSVSYSFTVVGGAPSITFNPLSGGGYWMNSTTENTMTFAVNSQNTLAMGGVVANIYTTPSNTLLQGPVTPTVNNNVYSIVLNGGIVPADQTGVRLEVIATDVFGGTSTSNQVYGIDNNAPQITIHTPVSGAEYTYESTVSITATVSDTMLRDLNLKNASPEILGLSTKDSQSRNGSGLGAVSMTVVKPDGTETTLNGLSGAIAETVLANQYGFYSIIITASDVAGNDSVASTNFIVPAPAPEITFHNLNGSWWINSTDENSLTFTVESNGVGIATGGVIANVYSVPANVLLQGPVTPAPVAGIYTVNLNGGIVPADQTGVRLEVTATNALAGTSTSNQIYGIDNMTPQIDIQSPLPNAQFAINSTVNIMATISDLAPVRALETKAERGSRSTDKSAGSGIAGVTLRIVGPNGATLFTEDYVANTQVLAHAQEVAEYGTYTVYITAHDNAQNQALASVSFQVVSGSAPTVNFADLAWLNNTGNNELNFTVNAAEGVNVTVTTELTAIPSGDPVAMTQSGNANAYTVSVNGSSIPQDATALKLTVTATDAFGFEATYSKVYNVDKTTPTILVFSPVTGTEVTLVDATTEVNIYAEYADLAMLGGKSGAKSKSGSGIAGARIVMTAPNSATSTIATVGENTTEISAVITNLMLGTYSIRLTVWDKSGNQVSEISSFTVIALPEPPLPPVVLAINAAHIYPNPMTTDLGAKFSIDLNTSADITVRIYDFAGREVRLIEQYASGKSAVEISWDGKNNNGQKLARGAYFARVIANDGKKIVEKVVKVAITK